GKGLAYAARPGIRQADRHQERRHEKYRRTQCGLDHGGPVSEALRGRDALGSFGRGRNRDGFAIERDQPVLGLRLWRAPARPASSQSLRGVIALWKSSSTI